MPIAKHLIVENGVLKVTDKIMPEKRWYVIDDDGVERYRETLESWKQEALVVQNSEIGIYKIKESIHFGPNMTVPEGIYDAPAGLEYEVKEVCNCEITGLPKGLECYGSCSGPTGKVAILSFASPKEETNPVKQLSDAIDNKGMKVSFGLQPKHIEVIENEISRYGGGDKSEGKFSRYIWEKLGNELSWEPLTLALYYFRHLRYITPASKEKPDFEAKVNFYREQTKKLREYLEVNRIGRANQNLFEALYDHVKEQREQIAALQEEIRQLKNKQ